MAPQHLILTAPSNPKKPCSCFIILLGITTYLMGLKREKKERQTTPSVKKNSFFFLVDFQKNFSNIQQSEKDCKVRLSTFFIQPQVPFSSVPKSSFMQRKEPSFIQNPIKILAWNMNRSYFPNCNF